RHTRFSRDWSSDVCSSDLVAELGAVDRVVATGTAAGGVELEAVGLAGQLAAVEAQGEAGLREQQRTIAGLGVFHDEVAAHPTAVHVEGRSEEDTSELQSREHLV